MQEIQWSPTPASDGPSHQALLALKAAAVAAKHFDRTFTHKHPDREGSIALLYPSELIMEATDMRPMGYYRVQPIKAVALKLLQGSFGSTAQMARERLAERVTENPYYCCKYLQRGLIDQLDHGPTAAAEMIMEVKLLMNLEPHPHIAQIYACNAKGIDSFLDRGNDSFFFITDRLKDTLLERMDKLWRTQDVPLNERLEIGLDISSALQFLHDRKIVYYVRPDKIGFDIRHNGRVKLCNFSQARQDGMAEVAASMVKSDDVVHILAYTAPEVLCKAPATCSSDVYAFAILLWEMITLKRPFDGCDRFQHYSRVVQAHERPPLDSVSSKNLQELLATAWHPHLRPTMKTMNKVMETMLLSGDPDDSAIQLATLLGKKPDSALITDSPSSGHRRPPRTMSKSRLANDNSARSARSTQSYRQSASDSPGKKPSYKRGTSLNKLDNSESRSPPGRHNQEENSVETTPTVRSTGSTGTNSAGQEPSYASPDGQRGRVGKLVVSQSSPASSYSSKVGTGKNSNASGNTQSDRSTSSHDGTFTDDVPWKTLKSPKIFPRRKSTTGVAAAIKQEIRPQHESSPQSSLASPNDPAPIPRRRHHRSASMDFAPRSTFDDFSPLSSPQTEQTKAPRRAVSQKSKRRASMSNPPSSEFKLDMVPEPTPLQRKKSSTSIRGSSKLGFMGFDNIGSPSMVSPRKTKTSGLPSIPVDSPPTAANNETSAASAVVRPGKSSSPQQGTGLRGKSPAPVKQVKQEQVPRRRPSMRKSASERGIATFSAFGNSPISDDDGVDETVNQAGQPASRVIRKVGSRRRMSHDGSINFFPAIRGEDVEEPMRGHADDRRKANLVREIVSDDDVRGSFTARLRAEMLKKESSGGENGKRIRVKVKSKKPSVQKD